MSKYRTWSEFKKTLNTDSESISRDAKLVNQIFRELSKRCMTIKEFAQKSGVHRSDIEKLEYERPSKDLLNKLSWILDDEKKDNI